MGKYFIWTDDLTKKFIKYGALSEDESLVLRTRARGYTVTQQADMLNCSERTVARIISNIKRVYDVVQKEHPDLFPIRKPSKIEKFMDEN